MNKYTLSIEEQIKVLTLCREKMVGRIIMFGSCSVLFEALNASGYHPYGSNFNKFIDGFNITNAKKLSLKYNFDKPIGFSGDYWWTDRTNIETWNKPRIAFIDALISELKFKLN